MREDLTKILIVEDNQINAELIKGFLAQLNYSCDIANNGTTAISLFLDYPSRYKAVILDIGLPDISGFIVAERIREADNNHSFIKMTPIIFLTADIDEQSKNRAKELQAYSFINKPISFEALKEILSTIN